MQRPPSCFSFNLTEIRFRSFSQQQAQQLSCEALGMERVEDIRLLFNEALEHAGIGGLVRRVSDPRPEIVVCRRLMLFIHLMSVMVFFRLLL